MQAPAPAARLKSSVTLRCVTACCDGAAVTITSPDSQGGGLFVSADAAGANRAAAAKAIDATVAAFIVGIWMVCLARIRSSLRRFEFNFNELSFSAVHVRIKMDHQVSTGASSV